MGKESKTDFIIIGSGPGSCAMAWVLANAGFSVIILEQGEDLKTQYSLKEFDSQYHNEIKYRLFDPGTHRRPAGDYQTFRKENSNFATPTTSGWSASVLGGGSAIWGGVSLRALPIDFRLKRFFSEVGQYSNLTQGGYDIVDWPIKYEDLAPYYELAEAFFGVSGDGQHLNNSIIQSFWLKELSESCYGNLQYPQREFADSPVAELFRFGFRSANINFSNTPYAINPVGNPQYSTLRGLKMVVERNQDLDKFWSATVTNAQQDFLRSSCNCCGFCGTYPCWGANPPRASAAEIFLCRFISKEASSRIQVICNARAFEVIQHNKSGLAQGVKYLDLTKPGQTKVQTILASNIAIGAGAIQSARLLLMSGPKSGLGNENGQIGKNVTFHQFGCYADLTLPDNLLGKLQPNVGNGDSIISYDNYMVQDSITKKWFKGGILTGGARFNLAESINQAIHLEKSTSIRKFSSNSIMSHVKKAALTIGFTLLGDDLPHLQNSVSLDPNYIDRFGLPVTRVTRQLHFHERKMWSLVKERLKDPILALMNKFELKENSIILSDPTPSFYSDHQMGTCRMGEDPRNSTLDTFCRLHTCPNVYVVDGSFMPTGLGVNPLLTIVANSLRVATHAINHLG